MVIYLMNAVWKNGKYLEYNFNKLTDNDRIISMDLFLINIHLILLKNL